MNAKQENRLSMYYTTDSALDKYSAVWTGILAFEACVSEFKTNIGAIESAVSKQIIDIRGYAMGKAKAEANMIQETVKVAGAAKAYATVSGKLVLATQMSVAKSGLRQFRDAVVAQACQGIHDAANAEVANLADYGISAVEMTALQDAIDAYAALISAPRIAITQRKGQTAEIALLIRDTYKLLSNRMDPLMGLFGASAPIFYREFFDARIIVDHRGSVDTSPASAEASAGEGVIRVEAA